MRSISKRQFMILFIFITVSLMLLLDINLSTSSQRNSILENNTELLVLINLTPTPHPLPEQRYNTSSLVTTLWRQLFGKKNGITDPSVIIHNSYKMLENDFFELYIEDEKLIIDPQWWQQESKKVFEYVSQKLDVSLDEKVVVVIVKPIKENCSPRGTTLHELEPIILLYADNTTSKEQILAVLAHELGHVFINKHYKNLSDVALIEGMATWMSGDYWEEWKGIDFDSSVKELVSQKAYFSLFQNFEMEKAFDEKNPACIANRDTLLTEFASFLDYLINEYGLDKLFLLFEMRQPETVNNQRIVYQPNYREVYGLELNQLEYNWLNHILGTNK